MWHHISKIAKIHRLPACMLNEFAKSNAGAYRIVTEGEILLVNTWHADSLIEDFMTTQQEGSFQASE